MKYTRRDFRIFVKEANRCLRKLGLSDWCVDFEFKGVGDKCYGQCRWNIAGKCAAIVLNSDSNHMEYHDPRITARHEVLELLLAEQTDHDVRIRHAIIRRLEKIL